MPPWAHTECDRFTGTIENKSTCAPISAILMTADNPASPPPITIILGTAGIVALSAFCNLLVIHRRRTRFNHRLLRTRPECRETSQSRGSHDEEQREAHSQKPLSRLFTGDDAPLRREQPYAIAEVPRGRDETQHIEEEQRRLKYFPLHFAERCIRVGVQIDAGKAHRPRMPDDVGEGDTAGPALRGVHPVAGPGIFDRIPIAAVPDIKTIERVE